MLTSAGSCVRPKKKKLIKLAGFSSASLLKGVGSEHCTLLDTSLSPAQSRRAVPRKLRIQYEGAIYHVMNRGDRREDIFQGDSDRQLFLKTLGEACAKTAGQIHAYCLMRNHFHLVVETPRANLVAGMKWLLANRLRGLENETTSNRK
jgi:REP element-mobilizing transposase RayT